MSINQIEVFDKSDCIKTNISEGNACIEVVREDEIVKKWEQILAYLFFFFYTVWSGQAYKPKWISGNNDCSFKPNV